MSCVGLLPTADKGTGCPALQAGACCVCFGAAAAEHPGFYQAQFSSASLIGCLISKLHMAQAALPHSAYSFCCCLWSPLPAVSPMQRHTSRVNQTKSSSGAAVFTAACQDAGAAHSLRSVTSFKWHTLCPSTSPAPSSPVPPLSAPHSFPGHRRTSLERSSSNRRPPKPLKMSPRMSRAQASGSRILMPTSPVAMLACVCPGRCTRYTVSAARQRLKQRAWYTPKAMLAWGLPQRPGLQGNVQSISKDIIADPKMHQQGRLRQALRGGQVSAAGDQDSHWHRNSRLFAASHCMTSFSCTSVCTGLAADTSSLAVSCCGNGVFGIAGG